MSLKRFGDIAITQLIELIKTGLGGKVDKVTGKGLSSNDYTSTEKSKLAGIADGANKYTHPSYTVRNSGFYKITVDATGHVTNVSEVSKADITGLGIPAQDTTYGVATTSADGLMSSTDKIKLNGVAEGANKYTHPSYTARTSGLYKITVDASGHVTNVSAVTKEDLVALGIPAQDTTYTLSSFGINASATELNYVAGVTSSIQTQLNNKVNSSAFAMVNVQLSAAASSVSIPSAITSTSRMLVFHNGLLLAKDIHYTVGSSEIALVDYTADSGDIFVFVSM